LYFIAGISDSPPIARHHGNRRPMVCDHAPARAAMLRAEAARA